MLLNYYILVAKKMLFIEWVPRNVPHYIPLLNSSNSTSDHFHYFQVELVIKEQNTVDALTMMEKYCHLLIEKRVLIKTKGWVLLAFIYHYQNLQLARLVHLLWQYARECLNRECPEELAEAISSLIYAASRWGEFPELHELREVFTSRYGNEFAAQCVELRNNCSVQPKVGQLNLISRP